MEVLPFTGYKRPFRLVPLFFASVLRMGKWLSMVCLMTLIKVMTRIILNTESIMFGLGQKKKKFVSHTFVKKAMCYAGFFFK